MIGIFGGTFDPIHLGHLRAALEVKQALGLAEVRFIPLAGAVHREPPRASAGQRIEMVRAAIAGQPGFVADDLELRRGGASFTVDTLAALRDRFPDDPLCLLVGADAFAGFADWRRPRRILELAHLAVMTRPGATDPERLARPDYVQAGWTEEPTDLQRTPAGCVLPLPVTRLDISSSALRRLLAAGQSVRYLVPEAVRRRIEEQRLYLAPRDPHGGERPPVPL